MVPNAMHFEKKAFKKCFVTKLDFCRSNGCGYDVKKNSE